MPEVTSPRVTLPIDPNRPSTAGAALLAPEIGAVAAEFSRVTYTRSRLSLREFEAARMMTALINGCRICQNWRSAHDLPLHLKANYGDGRSDLLSAGEAPDDAFYKAIPDWRNSTIFSAREGVAIEMAEGMGERPKEIARDEAFWRRAHQAFSDAELVDLGYCIACWMGLGRFTHIMGFDDVCNLPSRQSVVNAVA